MEKLDLHGRHGKTIPLKPRSKSRLKPRPEGFFGPINEKTGMPTRYQTLHNVEGNLIPLPEQMRNLTENAFKFTSDGETRTMLQHVNFMLYRSPLPSNNYKKSDSDLKRGTWHRWNVHNKVFGGKMVDQICDAALLSIAQGKDRVVACQTMQALGFKGKVQFESGEETNVSQLARGKNPTGFVHLFQKLKIETAVAMHHFGVPTDAKIPSMSDEDYKTEPDDQEIRHLTAVWLAVSAVSLNQTIKSLFKNERRLRAFANAIEGTFDGSPPSSERRLTRLELFVMTLAGLGVSFSEYILQMLQTWLPPDDDDNADLKSRSRKMVKKINKGCDSHGSLTSVLKRQR